MKHTLVNQCAAVAIALLSYATAARGSVPVPITNAGFENPVQATEGAYTDYIPGWTVFNGGDIGVWNVETTEFPAQAPEGTNVAYIYSATAIQGFGQVLSDPTGLLQAGASYSLTVKVGNSASYTGFPGYQVQLLAGTTVLAQDDNSSPPGEGLFVTSTVSYTYNPAHSELVGLPLEIRLLSKGLQTGENETEFDDVKLSATLADPVANSGGPYSVLSIGSLALNGSASLPSDGSSLSLYEWDLDDDGDYDEGVAGATPAAILYATLTAVPPLGYGMTPGDNTIKLRVTDATTLETSTASATVTLIVASSNANLSDLIPSAGTLNPFFDPDTLSYTASVPYGTSSMTVKPTREDATATITVNGSPVASGSPSASIPLNYPGTTDITTVVTAENTTTKTYTITVTREAPSSNANLSGLEPSAGTLSPGFDSAIITYTASVTNATASMTVTPTKEDANATITVNGNPVASGSPSGPISLSVGDNTITTVVTAEDGTTTKTYTLTVTRAPDTTPPAIASLNPADGTTVPATGNLVVTFDESIAIGTGNITIKNLTDTTEEIIDITGLQISVTGAVLTIDPAADFVPGKNYAVQIDATAIDDLFGNSFAGIPDDTTWNFSGAYPVYTWTQTLGGAQSWTTGVNWAGGAVPDPASGSTVDFSTVNITANTTLTLGADRTAGTWKFGDTSGTQTWTVNSGNKIILAGATPTIEVKQNTATLSNIVDGTQGLTKAGAGTLVLGGVNTYTGGTILSAGTLSVGANNQLGDAAGGITVSGSAYLLLTADFTTSRSITLNTGAIAQITGSVAGPGLRTFTVSGAVTGNGGIFLGGGNTPTKLILSNTGNSFTGAIFIGCPTQTNVGGLGYRLETASLADSASPTPITFGYANTAPGQNHEHSFVWTGASALVLSNRYFEFGPLGGGNYGWGVIENANTTAANTLTINTDLAVSGTGGNGSKGLTLQGANTGANTFAGKIVNGTGTPIVLLKAGAGTWVVSGNNTYSGGTTVNAGTLRANGANALGAGNVTVSAGTLQINTADAMADTASLYLPSATTKNLTMNANDTVAKLFIAGVQQPNGVYSAATNASAWMNTGSGILTVGPAAAQPVYWDLNDTANGAGGATPVGIWDAANMYWNNAAGTGTAAAWTAGATAAFAAGTDATGTYAVTVDGTPDIGGLTFEEGTVTLSGGTALRLVSDSMAFVNTGLTATIATPLTQDATARGLTKIGTGTLVLASGSNTFTGLTTVGAGTLQLTNTSAIGLSSGLSLATGGTLALRSDTSATFSTPANGVGLNTLVEGATASMDANNNGLGANQTLALGGGIRLTTTQSLTTKLNVTGGNGYALSVPSLTIANPVSGSPTVNFNPTTASVVIDALSASPRSASTIVLALDGTSSANVVNHSASSSTAWMQLTKQGTGTWTWNLNTETSGKLGNSSGGLSAGTLIVNGSLSFQGSGRFFSMSGGTLCLNSANAIGNGAFNALTITGGNLDNTSGSPVTLTSNPLMSWNGNFAFLGSSGSNSDLNLGTGAMTMNATRTVTVSNASATLTVGGIVSGSTFGLTKAGPGTLKLAGASTFNGATTVSAGTLAVTGSLGATAVSVNAGTLAGNGNIGGNVTIASGARHALAVAATPAGQDTSVITGTLTLTSGNILDLTAAATPAAGEYVLATATVGITGTPTTVNYNGISGTVSVDTASTPKRLLLTVTAAGFDSWKTKNGATGTVADDHDNDGVDNGVEYFLVGPNGNSTGFTALPGVSNTGGVLSVTWTKAADYTGVYLTDFVVETSESLTGTWTPEASPGNVTITGNQVKYTFPSPLGARKFARLKVTGP